MEVWVLLEAPALNFQAREEDFRRARTKDAGFRVILKKGRGSGYSLQPCGPSGPGPRGRPFSVAAFGRSRLLVWGVIAPKHLGNTMILFSFSQAASSTGPSGSGTAAKKPLRPSQGLQA